MSRPRDIAAGDVVRLDDPQVQRVERVVHVDGRVVLELRPAGLEIRESVRVSLPEGRRGRVLCMAVALHEAVWSAWLQAAWHPSDGCRREDLLRALGAVDAEPVRAWRDPGCSWTRWTRPSATPCTCNPHDEEAITAEPAVTTALRRSPLGSCPRPRRHGGAVR
jgi:hypothetical protein